MNDTFEQLRPEYETLLKLMKITRGNDALAVAGKLLKTRAAYIECSQKTGVPLAWLMAVNERESGGRLDTYLGNGDPLNRTTHDVPRGRGPFPTWIAGAIDALDYDHIAGIAPWSWARACYEAELWNGFGYRMHGRHSAYLWSGTSIYQGGKFRADDVWDPRETDTQLGVVPLMAALIKLDPSLQFAGGWPGDNAVPPAPQKPPAELNGGPHGMSWLQDALNHAMNAGLVVDGSYGRMTRAAVKAFQAAHGLATDGIAGPATVAALETALEAPAAALPAETPVSKAVDLPASEPVIHLPFYPIYDHDCAMLCEGLYAYPGEPAVGWNHIDAGEDDGVCYAVKRIGEIDVVVFRGSTTLEDWIRDAEVLAATPTDDPVLGPVHLGFDAGMAKVCAEVLSRDPKHVIVTGHSLGAARATLLAARLTAAGKPPLTRVVFGEPKSGYQQLAACIKDIPGRSYRNKSGTDFDLVTAMPVSCSFLPYVHASKLIDVCAAPQPGDPWGPLALHHVQLYVQALSSINTGTSL